MMIALLGLPACTDSVYANACTTASVKQAIASLPPGGTADLTSCSSMTLTGPISFGTPTAPVTVKLGAGTITFNNTSGHGFVMGGSGSRLLGSGANSTILMTTSGFTGDIIHIEPLSGEVKLNGIEVADLEIDYTNAPSQIGLNILSVRDPSSFHNLSLMHMTGTALQISGSQLSGSRLSQGIGLRDIYIETNGEVAPLTADTVVISGNQIYLGGNVKIVNMGPTSLVYRGLVFKPTPTLKGDGRYNTFFSGAVAGYGTCLSVETPEPESDSGSLGNIIGPGNTFENCLLAYQFTGVDNLHRATDNWGIGNAFINTPNVARLDFANDNFVQELVRPGNAGAITLTANSANNTVFARLTGGSDNVFNSGTANLVYSLLPTGFALNGDLHVNGTLFKTAGSFRIDHPLDPTNKYLQHSFVESPDMMNIYNGVVELDRSGRAEVKMPDYFEALNRDFRYQLTPIGSFAPLYVESEIKNNAFAIAGGRAGLRVSWQVTGIRHDAYANAHRIAVETSKAP